MKALILFYSTYGHMVQMAQAAAEGVKEAGGEAVIKRVPETLPESVLVAQGALEAQKSFAHIPVASVDELPEYDAFILGVPTRFGNMVGQMRSFWDATGGLWAKGALIGKVGSVISSTATQHGGQESTILSTHTTLLHHGMVIVGLPYSFQGQMTIDEVSGGSPYGASTITGGQGQRMPSKNELDAARFQGKHVGIIAKKLKA
jgi:NAD(P)H dehydrogenase (quinone)